MSSSRWRFAATSTIGASHLKTDRPCEDSHAVCVFDQPPDWLIACVSDGAGSVAKGREGAEFICTHFIEFISRSISDGMEIGDLTEASVAEWLRECRAELATQSKDADGTLRDYSATFLGTVIQGKASTFAQIGDGAIVVKSNGGDYKPVFWPEQGEYANQTVFVTSENAEQKLCVLQTSDEAVEDLAMFSDGLQRLCLHYATRTAHRPFFDKFFSDLRLEPAGASESMSQALQEFLLSECVNERTDDDKTLILASR